MNPEILDRLPPHDKQAELACLGGMILDPSKIDCVASIVKPEDFYSEAWETLYGHILDASEASEPIDALALANRVTSAGDMGRIGGTAGIAECMQSTPVAAHSEYYASIVAEMAKRRRLIIAATELMRSAHDGQVSAGETASKHADEITAIGASGHATSTVDVMTVVGDLIADLDSGRSRMGLPTGLFEFDNEIGGLRKSELIILAARPRIGKTALALNIMRHLIYSGRSVMFVTIEMSPKELFERMICSIADVDGNALRTDRLSDSEKSALAKAASTIPFDSIHMPVSTTITTSDLRWLARSLVREKSLDLIVVDHIGLLEPSDPKANRTEQVGQLSRDLKRLTLELNLPVLCLSQLNRQTEQKGNHIPNLAHLRGSGNLEQDADMVLFLHREQAYSNSSDDAGKAELIIAKNRNGPEAEIKLEWDAGTTTFRSNEPDYNWKP